MEGKGNGSLNKEFDFRSWHCGRQGGEVYHGIVQRQGGGSSNKDLEFRSWHCGRQGGKFK